MLEQIFISITIFAALNIFIYVPCSFAAYTDYNRKLLKLRLHDIKDTYLGVWVLFAISLIAIVSLSWLHVEYSDTHKELCVLTDTIESLMLSYVAGFIFFQINDFFPKTKEKLEAINGIFSCMQTPISILEELLLQNSQVKEIIIDRDDFVKSLCDNYNETSKEIDISEENMNYLSRCCDTINIQLQRAQNSYHGYLSLKYTGSIYDFACCNDDIKSHSLYRGYDSLSDIYDALKSIYKDSVEYRMDLEPYVFNQTHNVI